MRANLLGCGLLPLLMGSSAACVDQGYEDFTMVRQGDGGTDVPTPDAGDAGVASDAQGDALPEEDPDPIYRPVDPEGPQITIVSPQTGQVLSGDRWTVEAIVSDADGVDPATVEALVLGSDLAPMARAGTLQDQFAAALELGDVASGEIIVIVQAADLQGHLNSAEVVVLRDSGPTIEVTTPEVDARYSAVIGVSVLVSDGFGLQPETVSLAMDATTVTVPLLQADTLHGNEPRWLLYGGTVDLSASTFTAPLTGQHQLTVTATNANGVSQTQVVPFLVDDTGPEIEVTAPVPAQIVGGVLEIHAHVLDDAGIEPGSVVAVLAHDSDHYTVAMTWLDGAYRGTFDTKQLPTSGWYYPSISVRAADLLGNEYQMGFLVALDNAAPVVELDPGTVSVCDVSVGCEMEPGGSGTSDSTRLSPPVDPAGSDACGDASRVPQLFFIRPRIEDPSIVGSGMTAGYAAAIDQASPFVYFLPGDGRALVVDTDGDGTCDEINPLLIPSTQPQTNHEVLALNLVPIPPTGEADLSAVDPAELPPEPLCTVAGDMTMVIGATQDPLLPAIYSLPPVLPEDQLLCTGMQFDAAANNLSEGWVCIAVRVTDGVGNVGVSPPIRACVDYTLDGLPACPAATMPSCTGTLDPATQTVDSALPCVFTSNQLFPSNEIIAY